MDKDKELTSQNSPYYKQPERYAMDTFAYYLCYRCRSPYFGGKKECGAVGQGNHTRNLSLCSVVCVRERGATKTLSRATRNYQVLL